MREQRSMAVPTVELPTLSLRIVGDRRIDDRRDRGPPENDAARPVPATTPRRVRSCKPLKSGDTSSPGSGRDTATRALIRMSSASCASRNAIEVTWLPKKSEKSERSLGVGENDSEAAMTRCTPGIVGGARAPDGGRHRHAAVVVVVQMLRPGCRRACRPLTRNRRWRGCCRDRRSRWRDRRAPSPSCPRAP